MNGVRNQRVVIAERAPQESGWGSATVDQILNSISDNVYGDSTAVAVDAAGTQHVVFSLGKPDDRSLTYRRRVANSVPGPREYPDNSTLIDDLAAVVDSDGDVHVVYRDVVRGNLRYVRREATGGWSTPVEINAEGAGGEELSLVIDGSQKLHAIWTDSQRSLFYTSRCTSL